TLSNRPWVSEEQHGVLAARIEDVAAQTWASETDLGALAARLEEIAGRRVASEDDLSALATRLRDALTAQAAAAADQAEALSGRLDALLSDHAAVAQRIEAVASDNVEAQRAVDAETRHRNAADDETRRHVAVLAARLEEVADRSVTEEDLGTLADRTREARAAQPRAGA